MRRRRQHRSYGLGGQRTIYKGRLPRTLPGIPAPAGLTAGRQQGHYSGARNQPATRSAARPSLGTATAYVAAGTLLSRVTGLLRILVAIYALGYSSLSDSFNLANNTPNIVHDLVLGGILTATFVPVFVSHLATRSEKQAVDSISAVLTLAGCVLVAATVVFYLAAPYIIDLYTVGSHGPTVATEREVATYLLRLFSPSCSPTGPSSLMTAVLNTARRFSAPRLHPDPQQRRRDIHPVGLCGHRAHPQPFPGSRGPPPHVAVGVGTTLGVVVQALALVPSLLSCGLRVRPRWRPDDPAVREIISLSGWTFGFVIANQLAVFVVSAIAVSIGAATLTAYTYASTFFQLPFGIVAVSVMTTLSPVLAARFARGDMAVSLGTSVSGFAACLPVSSRPWSDTCCWQDRRSRSSRSGRDAARVELI